MVARFNIPPGTDALWQQRLSLLLDSTDEGMFGIDDAYIFAGVAEAVDDGVAQLRLLAQRCLRLAHCARGMGARAQILPGVPSR